jgi:glycosyltransferase involved in cell wall biosynthesis
MGFFPFAYWKAVRLIKKFGIEVVWTTSPPPSIHRVGVRLKQKLRVRWVADFRDPWSGESPLQGAPLWSKRREKLKNLLAEADWVTCVDDPIKNFLGELAGFEKVSTVFNGYDQADLPTAGLKQHEIFTLAYGGTLNLAHDPHLFLKGLSTWKKKRGVSFKLILVGRALGLPLEDWLDELDLTENTVLTGYLSHRRALQRLSEADLFLLFVAPEEKYRFTLTAKIFEYIGLGRPVLAVAPRNGAVADFLAAHPVGMLAGDEEAVVKVLEIYHRQWQLEKNLKISEEVRRRFGWDKEAAKLSAILEGN